MNHYWLYMDGILIRWLIKNIVFMKSVVYTNRDNKNNRNFVTIRDSSCLTHFYNE